MIFQRSFHKSLAGRAILVVATVCALTGSIATPGNAQPRITEDKHLRIASWNLADAATAGVVAREEPVKRRWRNTFGAERRIAAKPKFSGDRLKADVVLLQGVRSVREVRQIFPARGWKLILSRQVLELGDGRLNQATTVDGEMAITAVAVRYQLRLRVTALEHLSGLDGITEVAADSNGFGVEVDAADAPGDDPDPMTIQPPATAEGGEDAGEQFPDGVALRLTYSGFVIWVVSAELPSRCRTETAPCEPAARLKAWADSKRAEGYDVIIGGQLDPTLRQAGPNAVCTNQEIVADRRIKAETGADTVAGCIVFADIEAP